MVSLSNYIKAYSFVYSIVPYIVWGPVMMVMNGALAFSQSASLPSFSPLGGKFTPAATSGCISFSTRAPLFDSSGSSRSPCEKTASPGPYGSNAGAL